MTGKPWHIILNPKAGGGKAQKKWPAMQRVLEAASFPFEVHFTEKKGHATELVQAIIAAGVRQIVGVGGDGTNSEIVHGIMSQSTCPSTEIAYTLIPMGRGNDWARTYGFKADVNAFLERIQRGKFKLQDTGKVHFQANKKEHIRYFVNVAGMAYDGYLVKTSEEKSGGIKNALHYQWMILQCLSSYCAPAGKVRFNGQVVQDDFYLINVGICKYSGGGMQLVPHADPADGQLALTVIGNVPKWDVVVQTPRFYNGKIGDYRLTQLHQAKMVEVEHTGDLPIHLEVDGEYLGTSPAHFEIIEKSLKVLI